MKKGYVMLLAIALSFTTATPVEAQFLKKLGKALDKMTGGQVVNSATSNSTQSSSTSSRTAKPRYEIHTTASTKTMTLRGGVSKLCPFSCGVALVRPSRGNWFVIDKQGNKLFELPQGYAPRGEKFDNDRLMITAQMNSISWVKAAIISTKGELVKDLGQIHETTKFVNGVANVTVDEKGKYVKYYIDANGNILSRTLPYSKLYELHEGLRIFGKDNGGPYGYCDAKCNIVIPAQFRNADDFHNGLAAVQDDEGLWGFIDKTGRWVIQPQFSRVPTAFEGPYSMVKDKAGLVYFMDKQGEFMMSQKQEANITFRSFLSNGFAIWTFDGGRNTVLINPSFKVVYPVKTDDVIFGSGEVVGYNENYFQWKWNHLGHINRLVDWNGNSLLEFGGDEVFSDGICITWEDNLGGLFYFNDKGEVILKFQDTQF